MKIVIQNLTTNNKKARSHPGIEPLNLYQGFIVNITSPGQSLFWPTCNFTEGHALQPHPGNKMDCHTVQSFVSRCEKSDYRSRGVLQSHQQNSKFAPRFQSKIESQSDTFLCRTFSPTTKLLRPDIHNPVAVRIVDASPECV